MLQKPHWPLGLPLRPHHFQFQDRYHERFIARRLDALVDYAWGFSELAWDEHALATGQLTPIRIEAILPDGTPVACGTAESPYIPGRTIPNFGSKDTLDVYLGVPRVHPGRPNVDANGGARYVQETVLVPDFASGTEPVNVAWLRPNVSFLFEGERLGSYDALPCARLMRAGGGQLAFDHTFVPPVITVQASPHLHGELQHVLSALLARQTALQRTSARGVTDALQRWMLSLTGGFVPRLSEVIHQRTTSPLAAYLVLAEMLGALSAFTTLGDCQIPVFNYDELGPTFTSLFRQLSALFAALGAQQYRRLDLRRRDATTLFGELREPTIFRNEFFLGLTGRDPDVLRARASQLVKIASWQDLKRIVQSATSGVPARLDPNPPSVLPNTGAVYFRLEKDNYFSAVMQTGQIGIYHPEELGITEVALYVVDPSAA
ncbi:MAG: type VI secretion system baseplate subunit TssK [Polyangiaceae bacterium]|nr:type VI secretion system baseplate subunit TssK [Polyangiaceae bacterium]